MLNGSVAYLPAILFLTGLGVYHYQVYGGRPVVLAAAGLFLISLFFRTIDNAICDVIPLGAHYLWHVLNGVVLFLMADVYMQTRCRIRKTP
jgi:hypothetical protein